MQEVEIFTTTLTTPDNKRVIIPNSKLTSDNIINYTVNETRRVDMTVGVSYGPFDFIWQARWWDDTQYPPRSVQGSDPVAL